jgi:hypothetical protein
MFVVVAGEAGIGKTALLSTFATDRAARSGVVAFGRCDQRLEVAYLPLADALAQLVVGLPGEEVIAAGGPSGEMLGRILPALRTGELRDTADEPRDRRRLLDAIASLMTTMSRRTPLLLVLDDLQWADEDTLLALRHVVLTMPRTRLLVAATYRDTHVKAATLVAELVVELERRRIGVRIPLSGLELEDIHLLVRGHQPESPEADAATIAKELAARTAGNPFFVIESLRHMPKDEDGAIPRRIGALLEEWIGVLGLPTRRVLAAAALLGETIDAAILSATEGLGGRSGVVGALDSAVRARLLVEEDDGCYRFSHSLVRDALEAQLTRTARAALHAQLGAAIEIAHGDRDEWAAARLHHHGAAASLGSGLLASRAALQAAEYATSRLAINEGITHLEQGLAALDRGPPDDRSLAKLHLALAAAHDRRSDTRATRQAALLAAEAARRANDPRLLGRAVWWVGRRSQLGADPSLPSALTREALAALGEEEPALRSQLLANFAGALAFAGQRAAAGEAAAAALALARSTGDALAIAEALTEQIWVGLGSSDLDTMIATADELVAVAPDDWRRAEGLRLRAVLLMTRGDIDDFERDIAELAQLEHRVPPIVGLAQVAHWQATRSLIAGRFDECTVYSDEALALAPSNPNVIMSHAAQHLAVMLETGTDDEPIEEYRAAVQEFEGVPAFRAGLTMALARAGRHADAEDLLLALTDAAATVMPDDLVRPFALMCLAEAAAELGHRRAAAFLHRALAPLSGQIVVVGDGVGVFGAVDRSLGMLVALLGGVQASDRHFARAIALEERIGAPVLATRTRYWWARALLDHDPTRAANELHAVETRADQLGMTALSRALHKLR